MEIDKIFSYQRPKEGQPEKYEMLRAQAKGMARLIDDLCPDSPDKDMAINKLREVIMWANASIALN